MIKSSLKESNSDLKSKIYDLEANISHKDDNRQLKRANNNENRSISPSKIIFDSKNKQLSKSVIKDSFLNFSTGLEFINNLNLLRSKNHNDKHLKQEKCIRIINKSHNKVLKRNRNTKKQNLFEKSFPKGEEIS